MNHGSGQINLKIGDIYVMDTSRFRVTTIYRLSFVDFSYESVVMQYFEINAYAISSYYSTHGFHDSFNSVL